MITRATGHDAREDGLRLPPAWLIEKIREPVYEEVQVPLYAPPPYDPREEGR